MATNIKLIAGLGNPGKEYAATRHNAGAWWLQALCKEHNIVLQQSSKFHALIGKLTIADQQIHCLIPTTYMNLSGKAVASMAHYYTIAPEEILVVHDELDFAPGIVRLKLNGGHGGHNGLKDIISAIHSKR